MQIDHCLILAAGFGTRMGEIGKELPKVLWPVFEKSLLSLQVAYARSLGAKKIYINLHHMGEAIEEHCRRRPEFEGVELLWEKPEILDIGGAVHNLAARPGTDYRGRLLILNADQFFYLDPESFRATLATHEDSSALLFSYWVNSSQGYNALMVSDDRGLTDITQNRDLPPDCPVETYTGISVIDLGVLRPTPGKSSFFDSVCQFRERPVKVVLLANVDYWDFGTAQRYWDTCFRILETYRSNANHPFLRFLVRERALKSWKIGLLKRSYHARSADVINLCAAEEAQELGPSIILGPSAVSRQSAPGLWLGNKFMEVRLPSL